MPGFAAILKSGNCTYEIRTEEYKNVTTNDMHVIEAIGIGSPKNMTAVAKELGVTTGTLTISVNSLVKKGLADRVRSEEDRRVVLVSLSRKGIKAYELRLLVFYPFVRHILKFHMKPIPFFAVFLHPEIPDTSKTSSLLPNMMQPCKALHRQQPIVPFTQPLYP